MDIRNTRSVGTRYVLFQVDPVTRSEVYVGLAEDNSLGFTPFLGYAIPFENARAAYEFGAQNYLLDMKVGYR